MTKIQIDVTGASAVAAVEGILTGGMVGVPVAFFYDESWFDLIKTAVFRAGSRQVCVHNIDDSTTLPWEVLQPGCTLYIGVYGLSEDGTVAIPTVWAEVATVQPGADPEGDPAMAPTLPVWKQAIDIAQSVREDADKGLFDGYTPVRGVDYWTEADIAQLAKTTETVILGDIDTALDRILQLQQALVGGESL